MEEKRQQCINRVERRKKEKKMLAEVERKLQETKKKLKEDKKLRRREMEEKHKQEEAERQGVITEKKIAIQVEDSEQLTTKEEGEKMQDRELSHESEKLTKVTDMDLGQEPHEQDIDLMSRAPKVTSQSLATPILELVLSEQGMVLLLDDDPIMDVDNLSFEELQRNIVQAQKRISRMIMCHLHSVDATLAYDKFLLEGNE